MARKTKAQREAEQLEHRMMLEHMAREAYPKLLMEILERVTKLCTFDIEVREGKFVVTDRNDPCDPWVLTHEYTPDADIELDMLRWEVERQERAEEEANRKYLLKQSALAKLSAEEREILGV